MTCQSLNNNASCKHGSPVCRQEVIIQLNLKLHYDVTIDKLITVWSPVLPWINFAKTRNPNVMG